MLTTNSDEVIFAVEQDRSSPDGRVVLSATTLDGRHYAAPRGARVWLPSNRPLSIDDALTGEWTLLTEDGGRQTAPALVREQRGDGLWMLTSQDPIDLAGTLVDVEIHINSNRHDAVINVRCSPTGRPPTPPAVRYRSHAPVHSSSSSGIRAGTRGHCPRAVHPQPRRT